MDKFKAFILMICVALFGSWIYDLHCENESLMKEVDLYRTAYIKQLKKQDVQELKNVYQKAEEIYSVEAELLEAIERLETGNYTSDLYASKNNTWGAFDGYEYISFDSHEQSTVELARTLKFNYIDEGLQTIEEIGTKYCPTDENWAIKITQIYEEIKGE